MSIEQMSRLLRCAAIGLEAAVVMLALMLFWSVVVLILLGVI